MKSNDSLAELTSKRFNEILTSEQISAQPSVLVLRGFTSAQLDTIKNAANASECECVIPDVSPLDIKAVTENARAFLASLMLPNTKPVICIYEQFISVCDTLNAGIKLTDKQFFIIDNNLFLTTSPSLLSDEISQKLSEYFDGESSEISEQLVAYTQYYSDAERMCKSCFGVKHINKHTDIKLPVIPFFSTLRFDELPENDIGTEIEAHSDEMWSYLIDLLNGRDVFPVTIISSELDRCDRTVTALASVLTQIGVKFGIKKRNSFEEIVGATRSFSSLLHRLHGSSAEFRMLRFYKHPTLSNESIDISQEAVISDIVNQSEKALSDDKSFKNLFITAPTGAGKSLLFQLPAIYLAEQHNAVTIVVTPIIALMKDQVEGLENHGINCATYLNSTISFEERERRSAQIKSGEKSIVYLAPELLLSCPIETILGERKLGLFVVDEAHTVTTWGRDFRVDYWFLGDYLKKARRNGLMFPVLCLTATAVFGGTEDIVNETISTLNLKNTRVLLGNVKRDNIEFDIRSFEKGEERGSYEQVKIAHSARVISEYVDKDEKALIYCPYTTQVSEMLRQVDNEHKPYVGMYHGQLKDVQKNLYQDYFRSGKYKAMICTKAFGMGIDAKDIRHCYHFAPSGNLSDYVQEIGRIARERNSHGIARIDFSLSDMRYTRALRGMSNLKQYQLKEMIRKLYDIYSVKNHRNLLIAPDVFGYMFNEEELENKVKNGLLLISKDLEETYGFPVINIRPKTMFTKCFVCVDPGFEKQFTDKYHNVIRKIKDRGPVTELNRNPLSSDTIRSNAGSLYEVDMSAIWENEFSKLTFGDFKRRFFEGLLFSENGEKKLWPRVKMTIRYKTTFEEVFNTFSLVLEKLTEVFADLKENCGFFEFDDFKSRMNAAFESTDISINAEFMRLILDMFIVDAKGSSQITKDRDSLTFIQKRSANGTESTYRVIGTNWLGLKNKLLEQLSRCRVNADDNRFLAYVPPCREDRKLHRLLNLLEILELATYELRGGANTEIFVRINDPMKLRYLSQGRYSNRLLRNIDRKNKAATRTLSRFFQCDLTSEQRWDVIENYFLGNEAYVNQMLNIDED